MDPRMPCQSDCDERIFYRKLAVISIVYLCSSSESFMTTSQHNDGQFTNTFSRKILITLESWPAWTCCTSGRITGFLSTACPMPQSQMSQNTGTKNSGGKTKEERYDDMMMIPKTLSDKNVSRVPSKLTIPTRRWAMVCLTRASPRRRLKTSSWRWALPSGRSTQWRTGSTSI